jgi:hypothetical protein
MGRRQQSRRQSRQNASTDGKIKGFGYKASPDSPRYIVETDEGKRAAHKRERSAKHIHPARGRWLSTTLSTSQRLTFGGILNITASGAANRGFCWWNPTRVKFCHIGGSRRRSLPANQPTRFTACSWNTKRRRTSSGWIWRGSFFRWATPGRGDTPIVEAGANTRRGNYCPGKRMV